MCSEIKVNKDYAYTVDDIKTENIMCAVFTENMIQEARTNKQTQYSTWINYKEGNETNQLKIYTPIMKGIMIPRYDPNNIQFIKSETDDARYKIKPILKKDTEEEKKFYEILKYIDNEVGDEKFTKAFNDKRGYAYFPIIKERETENGEPLPDRIGIKIPKDADGILKCGIMEITDKKIKKVHKNYTISKLEKILHKNSLVKMVLKISRIWASKAPLGGSKKAYGINVTLDYIMIDNSNINVVLNPFGEPDEIEASDESNEEEETDE